MSTNDAWQFDGFATNGMAFTRNLLLMDAMRSWAFS
jgi:hypothetical protein